MAAKTSGLVANVSLASSQRDYDVVATFEAPDDASITALALSLGSAGNIRTQTMRAFTKEEVTGILAKL